MYVAIEGLKGTGKSTVLQALLPHIEALFDSTQQRLAILNPTKPMAKTHYLEQYFAQGQNDDAYLQKLYAARSNYHATLTDWDADLIISDRSIFTSLAVRWHHIDTANMTPVQHFKQVRQQEHQIAIPDLVIQLNAPNATLLDRYATRRRAYGQYEETIEAIIQLKNGYNSLYQWLAEEQTACLLGKSIPIYQLDTQLNSIEDICSDIFNTIQLNFAQVGSELLAKSKYSQEVERPLLRPIQTVNSFNLILRG